MASLAVTVEPGDPPLWGVRLRRPGVLRPGLGVDHVEEEAAEAANCCRALAKADCASYVGA